MIEMYNSDILKILQTHRELTQFFKEKKFQVSFKIIIGKKEHCLRAFIKNQYE